MKRTSVLATALLALGLVFVTAGCAGFSSPQATAVRRPQTYALIVSVSGGQAPTDAQWATMQKKFGALLAVRGLTLVTDPSQAEQLIQVLFVPDLDDPTTGVSYIVGLRANPANLIASGLRTFPPAGYGYTSTINYAFMGTQPQYYGYFPDYTDNTYTSTPTTPSIRPTPTPGHVGDHHTTRPVDCPPDEPRRPPSDYAGNHSRPSNPPSDGGHWWNSHARSDPGTSGHSSSSSSSSYSSGSSSSSDFVGPSTSYSSSASNSSPSISFSSDASSSSSSFSGSSGSSSTSGASSVESTHQKP